MSGDGVCDHSTGGGDRWLQQARTQDGRRVRPAMEADFKLGLVAVSVAGTGTRSQGNQRA
jgi:hypothetical protein